MGCRLVEPRKDLQSLLHLQMNSMDVGSSITAKTVSNTLISEWFGLQVLPGASLIVGLWRHWGYERCVKWTEHCLK